MACSTWQTQASEGPHREGSSGGGWARARAGQISQPEGHPLQWVAWQAQDHGSGAVGGHPGAALPPHGACTWCSLVYIGGRPCLPQAALYLWLRPEGRDSAGGCRHLPDTRLSPCSLAS